MKNVLVTGAFGGMGKAAVAALKNAGYGVFALDREVKEGAEGVVPIEADITSEESVAAAFIKVKERAESLYAIIHFAGVYKLDSLIEMPEKDFTGIFDINLFGAYRVNKAFLPLLERGGKIVITTSELAPLDPLPFTGIYAITKSALDKYAYSLRMEAQLLGLSVSVLRPGAVRTGMISASKNQLDKFCQTTSLYKVNAEKFKKIVDGVEAKNIPPEKVAAIAVKAISAKRPKFVYNINRNPLLRLLSVLPKRAQTKIIKKILQGK